MFRNLLTVVIATIVLCSEVDEAQADEPLPPEPIPIVNANDRLKPHHVVLAVGFVSAYTSFVTLQQYRGMAQERDSTTSAARYRQLSHQANGNLAAAGICGSLAVITLPIGLVIDF